MMKITTVAIALVSGTPSLVDAFQLGANPCTYGPSFFCASEANARRCNYDYSLCSSPSSPPSPAPASLGMPGSDPCTYGPSFWCASDANKKLCGFTGDCSQYTSETSNTATNLIQEVPNKEEEKEEEGESTTQSPTQVTSSPTMKPKVVKPTIVRRQLPTRVRASSTVVGTHPCTFGPSYYCQTPAHAFACGVDFNAMCYQAPQPAPLPYYPFYPYGPGPFPPQPHPQPQQALGQNKCTWGPSYWCASAANSAECGHDFSKC